MSPIALFHHVKQRNAAAPLLPKEEQRRIFEASQNTT
jgi:hypothetical protein